MARKSVQLIAGELMTVEEVFEKLDAEDFVIEAEPSLWRVTSRITKLVLGRLIGPEARDALPASARREIVDAAKRLKAELGAIVVSRSQSEDFSALMHADVMIGSCSTFSWWAAALRQKSQVHMPAFGVCDPRWKVSNSGAEEIDYDAGIAGWQWHDLFEMPNKPPGFDRGYGV